MLVDLKDGRMILMPDNFAGALVVNRGWEHKVKVYHNSGNGQGKELNLNTEYWVSDSPDGEEALLNIAVEKDISMDSGTVTVTNSGGGVPEYLAGDVGPLNAHWTWRSILNVVGNTIIRSTAMVPSKGVFISRIYMHRINRGA